MSFIALYSCMLLHCSEITITNKELLGALIDHHNNPTKPLLNLLASTQIEHNGTLSSIAAATQQWLRPAGKERWQHDETTVYHNNIPQEYKSLCLIQQIEPLKTHYDYAVFFGGVLHDVRKRLSYLLSLHNKGIRLDSIIILAGKRLLDTTIESPSLLLNNCHEGLPHTTPAIGTTETEMITKIWKETNTPPEWNSAITIIDTNMQKERGAIRRPNTQDTILAWLKEKRPTPGSVLAISNQPFVGYQNAVLRNTLPKSFEIETVGSAYENNESPAILLDSLARWIYNENQIIHHQQAKY